MPDGSVAFDPRLRGPILLSILAAVSTIVLKGAAYLLTGSMGLLADALESFVNLLAGGTAYFSLWYASRPADRNHTYGHQKIEFFSSGFEGMLVSLAGLGTVIYAIRSIITPAPLQELEIGVVIAMVASLINLLVAWRLLRVGKAMNSLVLQANGQHLMTDVYTSAGVLLALGLVWLTDVRLLDPILAGLIGLHILWTGVSLIHSAVDGLMDHALPPEELNQIRETIQQFLPEGAAFHLLRSRQAGRRKFVDFHLLLEGDLLLRSAHAIAHDLESQLRERFSELEVAIHLEPIDEPTSWEPEVLQSLGESSEPQPKPASQN